MLAAGEKSELARMAFVAKSFEVHRTSNGFHAIAQKEGDYHRGTNLRDTNLMGWFAKEYAGTAKHHASKANDHYNMAADEYTT